MKFVIKIFDFLNKYSQALTTLSVLLVCVITIFGQLQVVSLQRDNSVDLYRYQMLHESFKELIIFPFPDDFKGSSKEELFKSLNHYYRYVFFPVKQRVKPLVSSGNMVLLENLDAQYCDLYSIYESNSDKMTYKMGKSYVKQIGRYRAELETILLNEMLNIQKSQKQSIWYFPYMKAKQK